jgi:hypothetical protein
MYTFSEALALSVLCNIRATDYVEQKKVYHHNVAAEIEVSKTDTNGVHEGNTHLISKQSHLL